MFKQRFFKKLLLATFCLGISLNLFAQDTKKNLLFIITDQQSYDALSHAGNSVLQTPNLDRLAVQGAFFENAYSPQAVCCPARSSILTGHTAENTGMTNNDAYFDVDPDAMSMPTFDEILDEYGYRCEYYGKWHSSSHRAPNVYKNPDQYASNGSWMFGSGGQTYMYRDYLDENATKPPFGDGEFKELISAFPYQADPIDRFFGMTMDELEAAGLKHLQPDQHGKLLIDPEHTFTAYQAKQAIEAVERLKDEPFSITLSLHYPHSPMTPAEPYYSMYPHEDMTPPISINDDMQNSPYKNMNGRLKLPEYTDTDKIKYMISNYYGLVAEIDNWIGKLLDKLDEHNLTENTMVIFTSDHGEMLGAHGMREKNVFYEESSHIPLIMGFPGEIEAGITVNGYVSLIDLFPSILDYLNIPEHASDGISLRGLIDGTDTEHGQYVVTEWDFRGDTEPNYMVLKDGWKLMVPYTESSTVLNALYDLNTDPHEVNNLIGYNPDAADYEAKAEELRGYLLEWLEKNNSRHYEGVAARVLVGNAYFDPVTVWNPAANPDSEGKWTAAANWTNGLPGSPADKVVFKVPDARDVIIDEDVTASVINLPKIVQGDGGPGGTIIIQDGGAINTNKDWSAIGFNDAAELIVETGGEISFGHHLWIAHKAGADNCVVTINGGTIKVGSMFGMDWNGTGNLSTLNLNDGVLDLAQIHDTQSIGPNSKIVIDQGEMQVADDQQTIMQSYVDAGKIVSNDGNAITVTLDGSITKVKKASATNINSLAVDIMSIYPNPVRNNSVSVDFGLESFTTVSLSVLDMNGSVVSQLFSNRSFEPGAHQLDIPLENIIPGTYFMQVTFDGISQTHKIVVM